MKPSLSRVTVLRLTLVGAGCVLAVSLVIGREGERGESVVEPIKRAPGGAAIRTSEQHAAAKSGSPDLDLSRLNRATTTKIEDNLFALPVPKTPPLPAAPVQPLVEAPPAKPVAPPLPFKYVGQMTDRRVLTVFVSREEQYLSLKPGDVVDNLYRLEQADEGSVTFVYLPLKERQTLMTGERN